MAPLCATNKHRLLMVVWDQSYCKCWHSRLGPPQTVSSRVGQGTKLPHWGRRMVGVEALKANCSILLAWQPAWKPEAFWGNAKIRNQGWV